MRNENNSEWIFSIVILNLSRLPCLLCKYRGLLYWNKSVLLTGYSNSSTNLELELSCFEHNKLYINGLCLSITWYDILQLTHAKVLWPEVNSICDIWGSQTGAEADHRWQILHSTESTQMTRSEMYKINEIVRNVYGVGPDIWTPVARNVMP